MGKNLSFQKLRPRFVLFSLHLSSSAGYVAPYQKLNFARGPRVSCQQPLVRAVLCLFMTLGLGLSVSAENAGLGQKIEDICEGALKGKAFEDAVARWSGKTVIMDTNVLLNDPFAIYKYPGAEVVIPGVVLEEIDDKKEDIQIGVAARRFSREMDSIIQKGGNLRKGADIGQGTRLRVDTQDYSELLEDSNFDREKRDNLIIATAFQYYLKSDGEENAFLISDDINVRVKASSEGIPALPFEYEWVKPAKEVQSLYKDLVVTPAELQRFNKDGFLPVPSGFKIAPNEFAMLRTKGSAEGPDYVARYVFDRTAPEKSGLRKLADLSDLPFQPKNVEQHMALDVMMDPNVDLVILESEAGTGKTFVTLLAGMMQIARGKPDPKYTRYEDMMITRPLVHMGKTELGALPGDKGDKLAEYFNAYYDNLRILKQGLSGSVSPAVLPPNKASRRDDLNAGLGKPVAPKAEKPKGGNVHITPEGKVLNLTKDKNKPVSIPGVDLLAFPYIRGRSLHNTFLVVDEFQNTSMHEAKTLLTRLGEGSKVIVLGDTGQIDLPYLNARNNGLAVTISLFTRDADLTPEDRSRVAFVKFKDVVRSEFNDLANRQFKKPLPRQ